VVEQWPKMEGRQLVMVLAPKVKQVQAKPAKAKAPSDAGTKSAEGAAKRPAKPKPAAAETEVPVTESAKQSE
jgi:hypothetical protein